eukprot:192868-Prymnesium_polylepis.1
MDMVTRRHVGHMGCTMRHVHLAMGVAWIVAARVVAARVVAARAAALVFSCACIAIPAAPPARALRAASRGSCRRPARRPSARRTAAGKSRAGRTSSARWACCSAARAPPRQSSSPRPVARPTGGRQSKGGWLNQKGAVKL